MFIIFMSFQQIFYHRIWLRSILFRQPLFVFLMPIYVCGPPQVLFVDA